jgi:hypothetical protein
MNYINSSRVFYWRVIHVVNNVYCKMYVHTYVHTYIHNTYIHTYIRPFTHACIYSVDIVPVKSRISTNQQPRNAHNFNPILLTPTHSKIIWRFILMLFFHFLLCLKSGYFTKIYRPKFSRRFHYLKNKMTCINYKFSHYLTF